MKSKTTLQHTCLTEAPFKCMTGDFSDQGFLVVVDRSTHEVVVEEQTAETVTLAVNPLGVKIKRSKPRPGTRMLGLDASPSDPLWLAAESLERFLGRRRGRILYVLGLHAGGSVTLTVFDRDGAASARLSDPLVEQLIERLRSRDRGHAQGGAIGTPRTERDEEES